MRSCFRNAAVELRGCLLAISSILIVPSSSLPVNKARSEKVFTFFSLVHESSSSHNLLLFSAWLFENTVSQEVAHSLIAFF